MRALLQIALAAALAHPSLADEPQTVQFERDDASASWRAHVTRAGVTIEKRSVEGSSFLEYRSVVSLPQDPAWVAEQVWRAFREADMEGLKKREFLRVADDELLFYDQIKTPIVSDRDYTLLVKRIFDPARRRTQVRCWTANQLGPPVAKGYVRIPIIRAGFQVEPDGSGTRLTYYAFGEPGGLVPAWLVRSAQGDHCLLDVLRMLRRLNAAAAMR
jgi:hypothetical protein